MRMHRKAPRAGMALVAALWLPALAAEAGETFRTERGKEYRECTELSRDPHGITFKHSGGIAKLAYSEMPNDFQKRFKYDPKQADAFVAAHRPKPPRVHRAPTAVPVPRVVPNSVRASAYAAHPRRYPIHNPYLLSGPITNPAVHGAAFGGFLEPYYAGAFGNPALLTKIPHGFFTSHTLRVGARPILDSPIAPGMSSFSQVRDARMSAVRAAARAVPAVRHGKR